MTEAVQGNEKRIWRQSPILRTIAYVGLICYPLVFIGVIVVQLVSDQGEPLYAGLTMLLFLPFVLTFWLGILRPWIATDSRGITIRNPLSKVRFEWDEILDCAPGYYGLTITAAGGLSVTAIAVQKANASTWTGKRTRSDELCDLIKDRASVARP